MKRDNYKWATNFDFFVNGFVLYLIFVVMSVWRVM